MSGEKEPDFRSLRAERAALEATERQITAELKGHMPDWDRAFLVANRESIRNRLAALQAARPVGEG